MCGIFFSIARDGPSLPDDATVAALKARGPDSYRSLNITLPISSSTNFCLTFVSSVLALRGSLIQEQPLVDPTSGSVLCWNGEAWKVDGVDVAGNDSAQIFDLLLTASRSSAEDGHQSIARILTNIAGPFAYVFYDAISGTVYYGRDRLGRRSLLTNGCDKQSLMVSSIGISSGNRLLTEVPTDSIHYCSLDRGDIVAGQLSWLDSPPAINKTLPPPLPAMTPSSASVDSLLTYLRSSLELRVVDIPDHTHSRIRSDSAKVAILFSGGLDCALAARLAHNILPQSEAIDLLNVAFENPRSIAAQHKNITSPYELCPDRITGRSSFAEICRVCPNRRWRFVAIDVPYTDSLAHRQMIIDLMRPHNTEMDLSIAMALYFAARGQGSMVEGGSASQAEIKDFNSTARVLLSGLGADELYAGYSRHSAAFGRGGYAALADELELDFNRIGSRNLGRDDRVMSHWGKEVRYPYLDEDFVRFSLSLPVWEKSGFRPEKAIPKHYEEIGAVNGPEDLDPAKMLLRLAMWRLDMKIAASERKRAIQFGARTAKMDVGKTKTKGTDILVTGA